MPPPSCPLPVPAAEAIAARLLASLEGLDLTSADGRAGLHTLLAEIERACPGAILQQAARIELRALGWGAARAPRHPGAGRDERSHPPRSSSEAPRAER